MLISGVYVLYKTVIMRGRTTWKVYFATFLTHYIHSKTEALLQLWFFCNYGFLKGHDGCIRIAEFFVRFRIVGCFATLSNAELLSRAPAMAWLSENHEWMTILFRSFWLTRNSPIPYHQRSDPKNASDLNWTPSKSSQDMSLEEISKFWKENNWSIISWSSPVPLAPWAVWKVDDSWTSLSGELLFGSNPWSGETPARFCCQSTSATNREPLREEQTQSALKIQIKINLRSWIVHKWTDYYILQQFCRMVSSAH